MNHVIIVKIIKKSSHHTSVDIVLDKELQSLQNVLPNDLIKSFSLAPGGKGHYRSEKESYEREIIEILKALLSMHWRTITSHALLHIDHTEETRFYLEREPLKEQKSVAFSQEMQESSNRDDSKLESLRAAFRASSNSGQGNTLNSTGGLGSTSDESKPKRPTLSPEAVASILGKTSISNNSSSSSNNTNNSNATGANYGFAPRHNSIVNGAPSPKTNNESTSIPSSNATVPQIKPEATNHTAAASSAPVQSSSTSSVPAPQNTLPPGSRISSSIAGLSQRYQVQKDSSSSSNKPSLVSAASSSVPSPTPPQSISQTSSSASLRAQSSAVAANPIPILAVAPASNSSDNADTNSPAQVTFNEEVKSEAKNPNSVVNKLLGKYNRKSFIGTGKPSLVNLQPDQSESTKGAALESVAEEPAIVHEPVQPSNPPTKVEERPFIPHSASMPIMTSSAKSQAHSAPAVPVLAATTVPDDIVKAAAQDVIDRPSNNDDDDVAVSFNRNDLLKGKYATFQRQLSDPHEHNKTNHYSKLGSAFVNENSLLGGRGGRGRGGRGRGLI